MRILITAGPTREYLDDVRYLSNASTGQMGLALARAAKWRGHRVTLVHGPLPCGVVRTGGARRAADKVVSVTSALEMYEAVAAEFPRCDAFISCAAVSDYRPKRRVRGKLKRESSRRLVLQLVQNPDIVRAMAKRPRRGQVVVGFALETHNGRANAMEKLRRKGLDAIVLNPATAIGSRRTQITVLRRGQAEAETIRCSKSSAARRIVAAVEQLVSAKRPATGRGQILKRKVR